MHALFNTSSAFAGMLSKFGKITNHVSKIVNRHFKFGTRSKLQFKLGIKKTGFNIGGMFLII